MFQVLFSSGWTNLPARHVVLWRSLLVWFPRHLRKWPGGLGTWRVINVFTVERLQDSQDTITLQNFWVRMCDNIFSINNSFLLNNRFPVAVCLYSNRSQMASKCGRKKKWLARRSRVCHWNSLTLTLCFYSFICRNTQRPMRWMGQLFHIMLSSYRIWGATHFGLDRSRMDRSVFWSSAEMAALWLLWKRLR